MPPSAETYVPTLAIRPSEMNGLEYLPRKSKERLMPMILLAPWSSSHSLDKAMERVARAYPQGKLFLDPDRDYVPSNSDSPAQAEWLELRNPANSFQAWRAFCRNYPRVVPCLQLEGQTQSDILKQARDAQDREAEFCLRIELARRPINLSEVVEALVTLGTADYTVVIEGGWRSDPLSMLLDANGLINGVLDRLDGRVPFVVSCTSIPKSYGDIEGIAERSFSNRNLVNQLRRSSNRDVIIYGDWASTKPRDNSGERLPPPRIDYPAAESWLIARDTERNWSYRDAAQAIVQSPAWDGNLNIWGEEMIEQTVIDPAFAIDTAQKNIAARVNIHLHLQALFGEAVSGINLDEDWVDL